MNAFRDSVYNNGMTLKSTKTFNTSPLVSSKSAQITAANGSTALATEAQVYNTVKGITDPIKDSIWHKDGVISGLKTFDSQLTLISGAQISGHLDVNTTSTFTYASMIPTKNEDL